jgi:hypothetical protein
MVVIGMVKAVTTADDDDDDEWNVAPHCHTATTVADQVGYRVHRMMTGCTLCGSSKFSALEIKLNLLYDLP